MPRVNIVEIDKSLFRSRTSDNNNIVFVPGSAITGLPNTPVLLESYNDLVSNYGDDYPEGNLSYLYAGNLLQAGFKVLYYRVVPVSGVISASATISNMEKPQFKVSEIYGGTFGNSIKLTIDVASDYYIIKLTRNNKVIETLPVSTDKTNSLYIGKVTSKYVTFTILNDTDLSLSSIQEAISLAGGMDAPESEIRKLIPTTYPSIEDLYTTDVKFITSGGYINSDIEENLNSIMVELAEKRQDCLALLDLPFGTGVDISLSKAEVYNTSYGAMYAPWVLFEDNVKGIEVWMPGSFIFLYTLALMTKNYPITDPPAGVKRMTVSDVVKTEYEVGEAILDRWQHGTQFINPIMNLRSYGYVVFGNKTLYKTSADGTKSALQSVNVRITANEIKKIIRNICIGLTFDQNDTKLWNDFRGQLEPELRKMKENRALYDYQVIMDETTVTAEDQRELTVPGIVRVSMSRAAEFFDISFELTDTGVSFNTEN